LLLDAVFPRVKKHRRKFHEPKATKRGANPRSEERRPIEPL
jgi:hypothetical protein